MSYVGAFLLAFVTTVSGLQSVALPLISLGMMGAVAQIFFSYEDLRTLDAKGENEYQLSRSSRLYNENFIKVKQFPVPSYAFYPLPVIQIFK